MKVEELLADKKMTRKALAELVEGRWTINREHVAKFADVAKKLSEAIADEKWDNFMHRQEIKQYPFDEALTRACELIKQAKEIPTMKADFQGLLDVRDKLLKENRQLTAERDTAQEAAAAVGATFNQFRRQGLRMGNPADAAGYLLQDGDRVFHEF